MPAGAHHDTGLDAPLWGHDANEENVDAGEGVGIDDLDDEDDD